MGEEAKPSKSEMFAVCVTKDFGDEKIIVTATLYPDQMQLAMHTIYFDGRFSQVQLYVRYSTEPIVLDESVADEICSQVKEHIKNMTALSDLYYLKKYTMAFNRRMFFPNKWGPIKRIEDK